LFKSIIVGEKVFGGEMSDNNTKQEEREELRIFSYKLYKLQKKVKMDLN
jgi:hypothetical protein